MADAAFVLITIAFFVISIGYVAACEGYDAANSAGSHLGPTNKKLIDAVKANVEAAQKENPGVPVPIDLVTTSASGIDPHITPAAAGFQVPRVARERGMAEADVQSLVAAHTEGRQLGLLGEPRVNVLELNLALDAGPPLSPLSLMRHRRTDSRPTAP